MIDLHMHTTKSDGQYSPAEVLKMCEEAGLTLISITDHHTVNGYQDLQRPEVRRLFSGRILAGCEFPAHFKGQSIEILGYGIELNEAERYLARYSSHHAMMATEMELALRQYRTRDFLFDEEEVRKQEIDWLGFSGPIWREIIRHPENRERLLNPRSATDHSTFFRAEMCDRKSPFFYDTSEEIPSAREVCTFIHEAGGIAVVAHPLTYSPSVGNELEELISFAKPDGLEVWYSTYDDEQRAHLMKLCEKYHLIFSGGSDFHNDQRIARGNVIGVPHLADKFPTEEILKWVDHCKMV